MLVSLLFLVLLVLIYKFAKNYKYKDFKGPSPFASLPLIGHAHLLGDEPAKNLSKMRDKYGDIFRCDIGNEVTIVLCTSELAFKAFKQEVFNGRPYNQMATLNAIQPVGSKGQFAHGVVVSEGNEWHEQRKFMVKNLSDLGIGKRDTMEVVVEQEARQLVEGLLDKSGSPVPAKGFCQNAANNVIWRIITGKRTKQDDPELSKLTQFISQHLQDFDPGNPCSVLQLNCYPLVKLLSWMKIPNQVDNAKKMTSFLWNIILESEPNAHGNYVERGLQEIEDAESVNRDCFNQADGRYYIRGQLQDIFIGGTDTSATMTEWCVLYLLRYPKNQDKIFNEISHVTDCGSRQVAIADSALCHFTNSFMDEVGRHCEFIALPPMHKTLSDVEFEGYRIPKNTQVASFLYGINNDPAKFAEPRLFNPSRFVGPDGRYRRSDDVVIFGTGKRRCPGEALGRADVFLFLATLVQNLVLEPVPGDDLWAKARPGLAFYPPTFSFVPVRRHQTGERQQQRE